MRNIVQDETEKEILPFAVLIDDPLFFELSKGVYEPLQIVHELSKAPSKPL